jgi:hypothetical protein
MSGFAKAACDCSYHEMILATGCDRILSETILLQSKSFLCLENTILQQELLHIVEVSSWKSGTQFQTW